jgi:MFS family permease
MSQVAFSFVTAIFTIGGLCGSLVANLIMDSIGRRGTLRLGAILVVIGTAFMGLGTSLFPFLLGR